jgi:hypothetical protein
MSDSDSRNDLEHLASKLSKELEELKKTDGAEMNKAIVQKEQLLKELKAYLDQRNKDAE